MRVDPTHEAARQARHGAPAGGRPGTRDRSAGGRSVRTHRPCPPKSFTTSGPSADVDDEEVRLGRARRSSARARSAATQTPRGEGTSAACSRTDCSRDPGMVCWASLDGVKGSNLNMRQGLTMQRNPRQRLPQPVGRSSESSRPTRSVDRSCPRLPGTQPDQGRCRLVHSTSVRRRGREGLRLHARGRCGTLLGRFLDPPGSPGLRLRRRGSRRGAVSRTTRSPFALATRWVEGRPLSDSPDGTVEPARCFDRLAARSSPSLHRPRRGPGRSQPPGRAADRTTGPSTSIDLAMAVGARPAPGTPAPENSSNTSAPPISSRWPGCGPGSPERTRIAADRERGPVGVLAGGTGRARLKWYFDRLRGAERLPPVNDHWRF